jgi:hypothetical protein
MFSGQGVTIADNKEAIDKIIELKFENQYDKGLLDGWKVGADAHITKMDDWMLAHTKESATHYGVVESLTRRVDGLGTETDPMMPTLNAIKERISTLEVQIDRIANEQLSRTGKVYKEE